MSRASAIPRNSATFRRSAPVACPFGPSRQRRTAGGILRPVLVYAVVDDSLSPTSPLGDAIDVFIRREDAERFIAEIRGDDPELAQPLRIVQRELRIGGRN